MALFGTLQEKGRSRCAPEKRPPTGGLLQIHIVVVLGERHPASGLPANPKSCEPEQHHRPGGRFGHATGFPRNRLSECKNERPPNWRPSKVQFVVPSGERRLAPRLPECEAKARKAEQHHGPGAGFRCTDRYSVQWQLFLKREICRRPWRQAASEIDRARHVVGGDIGEKGDRTAILRRYCPWHWSHANDKVSMPSPSKPPMSAVLDRANELIGLPLLLMTPK